MLQLDRGERLSWNPIEAAFAGYRGGIAPSRHEVALTNYLEKQRACRESVSRGTRGAGPIALLRKAMSWVGRDGVGVREGNGFAAAWQRMGRLSHRRPA